MDSYQDILLRLEAFTKKYYTQQLIKGVLLFLCLGLLFWLSVLALEYLLWLDQGQRLVLFWGFVGVELFLVYRFILSPLLYLLKVRKGMGPKEASLMIGRHFPQVEDKLYNLLELSQQPQKTDLLLASIAQRSQRLGTVPFSKAIDLREAFQYARYVLVPLLILGLLWISGNLLTFFGSHQRLVHYDLAYERPAPFRFRLLNESLQVLDNRDLTVEVALEGEVRPEFVYLVSGGERLLLGESNGIYRHTFEAPVATERFYLTANGWDSETYAIERLPTPSLLEFNMELEFPPYLKRPAQRVKGSGNATVPEGTRIHWAIAGNHIGRIDMDTPDSTYTFHRVGEGYAHTMAVYRDLEYSLGTSNAHVERFETLDYGIRVIPDGRARVVVEQFMDSINPNISYYRGQAADDHGIQRINLVCFPLDDRAALQRLTLERPGTKLHQFYYSFPSGLELEPARNYALYFEVVDNDALRGGKVTESQLFNLSILDTLALRDRALEFQNNTLSKMDGSLDRYREHQQELDHINREHKQRNALSFEDKGEIKDFLRRQERQESMMERFSQELGQSLSKNQGDPRMKALLQERLERQEREAQQNAQLLEELQKVADKLKKEELEQRLEALGKNQGNNIRSLEQLLELTKRYYVTERAAQLSQTLEGLAQEQESLSKSEAEPATLAAEQQRVNGAFKEFEAQLRALEKDNEALKRPLDFGEQREGTQAIKSDQQKALEELQGPDGGNGAPPKAPQPGSRERSAQRQAAAAQKMKELSQSLDQGSGDTAASDAEDAEMLRQILDNLLRFSFKQEELFDHINGRDVDVSQFSRTVRDQQDLRRLFEHVDDSLFALSLRRVELSEFVNQQIGEVYYNMDRSLEMLAENQLYQGASHQQYVISATNALADFLAHVLEGMQQRLGQGGGSQGQGGFQLPDIIRGQQRLQERLGGAGGQGQEGEPGKPGGQGQGEPGESKDQRPGQGEAPGEGGSPGAGGGSELGLEEIYEIYKQQQFLRQKLEAQLQDMIRKEDRELTGKLLQQMEDFQNDLLENGITPRTLGKANNIQHQLLRLEHAAMEQGMEDRRESSSGLQQFTNPITTKPEQLKDYRPGVEILNRQALPLHPKFEERINVYFKND